MIYQYDVGVTFSGKYRWYVEEFVHSLERRGFKVFYDHHEDLLGKDLSVTFSEVFKAHCQYCVMFIDQTYVKSVWTKIERISAQERTALQKEEYILPGRFDDTEVPGLNPDLKYEKLTEITPYEFANIILLNKLGQDILNIEDVGYVVIDRFTEISQDSERVHAELSGFIAEMNQKVIIHGEKFLRDKNEWKEYTKRFNLAIKQIEYNNSKLDQVMVYVNKFGQHKDFILSIIDGETLPNNIEILEKDQAEFIADMKSMKEGIKVFKKINRKFAKIFEKYLNIATQHSVMRTRRLDYFKIVENRLQEKWGVS